MIDMNAHPYDVVVVGGGAAGLNGALVLGPARRPVAVIDAGAPRNAPAASSRSIPTHETGTPLMEITGRPAQLGSRPAAAPGRHLFTVTVLLFAPVLLIFPLSILWEAVGWVAGITLGWLLGLALLWSSRSWTLGEKGLAALVWSRGLALRARPADDRRRGVRTHSRRKRGLDRVHASGLARRPGPDRERGGPADCRGGPAAPCRRPPGNRGARSSATP